MRNCFFAAVAGRSRGFDERKCGNYSLLWGAKYAGHPLIPTFEDELRRVNFFTFTTPAFFILMRKFLQNSSRALALGAALLVGASRVSAQVSAYAFAASTGTFTPLPATATNVPSVLGDDVTSGTTPLPLTFNFVYEGTGYTGVVVSSNGFLSFNPASGSNLGNSLSGTGTEKPLVAPFWDDLDGRDPSARASYLTTGTAPNRVFTFEWLNWFRYGNSGGPSFSMQVRLLEGSNRVEFAYRRETGTVTGASASVGLSGAVVGTTPPEFLSLDGTTATPIASPATETNTIAGVPATGQVYTFTPGVATGCAAPRSVAATNITGNSASITFRGATTSTSYTVTYQAAGGPVQTVSPNPTTGPVALSGLLRNTAYTETVAANCAGGVTSPTATTTFSTSNGYCATGLGGSCGGNDVSTVSVSGSGLTATGLTCAAGGGGAYTSYPATAPNTGTLQRGVTYPISVTTTGNSIISVWIDFNQDLTFDATEWAQIATTSTAGTADVANMQVPLNALLGQTGMRVRSRLSGNMNGAADACANFGSGETKDFTITIGAAPACAPPSNLTATNITATGATLSFLTAGTGTATLVYGPTGFNPATGGTTISPATSPIALTNLTPGAGYQFYVQFNCGAAGLSQNTGPASFNTLITNDDPCGATVLPVANTCTPLSTTTVGANTTAASVYGPGGQGTGCGFNTTAPRDVWFQFTTAASGPTSTGIRISVTGGAASAVRAYSGAACTGPLTYILCAGTANGTAAPNLDLTSLQPSTTYYVRVNDYSSFQPQLGPFTICATPVPNCPAPAGFATGTLTNTTAPISWNGGAVTGSTFTVIYGPTGFSPTTGGTTLAGLTTASTTLTGLQPTTGYDVYIQQVCGGFNGSSTLAGPFSFSTPLTTPANDEPCGATALGNGTITTDSNVGSTTSLQNGINLPACSPANAPKDVWFSFTAAQTTSTLTLTGSAAGMVRVFTSPDCANGPFMPLVGGCASSGANNTGVAGVALTNLTVGQRYYVAVSGYGSSNVTGSFTISATNVLLATRAKADTNALLVYPNPSNTGQLTLRLVLGGASGLAQLSLLNTLGQTVYAQTAAVSNGALERTISTRTLAAGVYTLRLKVGEQLLTRKVVLE